MRKSGLGTLRELPTYYTRFFLEVLDLSASFDMAAMTTMGLASNRGGVAPLF